TLEEVAAAFLAALARFIVGKNGLPTGNNKRFWSPIFGEYTRSDSEGSGQSFTDHDGRHEDRRHKSRRKIRLENRWENRCFPSQAHVACRLERGAPYQNNFIN